MSCTRVVPHQLVSGRYGFRLACLVVLYLGITSGANATVIPIDLTNFFTADLPAVVVTDSDTASMTDFFTVQTLTLDPGLGDPDAIFAAASRTLTFGYVLDLGLGNIDEFSTYLFDAEFGPLFGVLESVTIATAGSGNVSFDLSAYIDRTLGLQFELYDPGFDVGATVMISNLALVDPALDVPGPATWAWFMLGVFIVVCLRGTSA